MTAPIVTRDDIRQLIDSSAQEPVLYLKAGPDDEGGTLELDVWAAAYVPESKVVVHRRDVVDAVGDAPDTNDLDHYLGLLQATVDDVAAAMA
jgi:hypothetical protein